MDEIESALVWSETSNKEIADFYEAAFLASQAKRGKLVDSAEILAARIAESISRIVHAYGSELDQDTIVVKFSPAEENGGFWTFDVRFTVKGEPRQFLTAARSLHDINKNLNNEISSFVRGMNVKPR